MIRFPFVKPKNTDPSEDQQADQATPPAQDGDVTAPSFFQTPKVESVAAESPDPQEASSSEALGRLDAFGHPQGQPSLEEQMRMIEAMLFASDKPLSTAELASRMPLGCDAAVAVRRLEEAYATRGVSLARVAGKWAFRTAPDLAHLLTGESVEQRKLSRAAVETLAIIAYHQPITRAEIEEIRQVGVSKGTVDLLMELEWIKLGRRRQTPGRPVTFLTTDRFLEHFGLETLKDLPRLEELRQSGLLDNAPPVGFSPTGVGSLGDADAETDGEDGAWDDAEKDAGARQQDLLM